MRKIALFFLSLFAITTLSGCDWFADDPSTAPADFHNQSTLQKSVREEMTDNLNKMDPGATLNDVSCVEDSDRHWECLVDYTDSDLEDSRLSIAVTVNEDYSSWVSHAIN